MRVLAALTLLWTATVCAAETGTAPATVPATAPATVPASAPSTAPAAREVLAAECVVHSARSLGHLRDPQTVAQTGRIRVLLQYAERLWPDSAGTNRQLVDLYEGLGDLSRAQRASRRYLLARPDDYAAGLRWIRLSLAALDNAEQRIEFLKGAAGNQRFAKEIRAAAWAELCGLHLRQSDPAAAGRACREALSLDPCQVGALEASGRVGGQPPPAELLEKALMRLRGDPRSLHAAWTVGRLLQQGGLYVEALAYYEHAHEVAGARRAAGTVMEPFLTDYFNAMLDARRTLEAFRLFEPIVGRYGWSLPLRALMVEACGELKNHQKAAEHVKAMEEIYKPLASPTARRSGEQAAELAWFHLAYKSQPKVALQWATEAARSAADDAFVRRVLGAAELAAGEVDSGLRRLAPLAGDDPHAAAVLARYYLARGDNDTAAQTLRKYTGKVRTGMGWRNLSALAAQSKLALPAAKGVEALREVLRRQPPHVLRMGRSPEKFVSVRLKARRAEVEVGEPVEIAVTMENVSAQPVPLGERGLFNPVVFLSVSVAGATEAKLADLTPVALPAPRYLRPGEKVSQTARVDVGRAEQVLAAAPLADLTLTVTGMLDPLQVGEELFSSVPEVKIAAATLRRKPLLDASKGEAAARDALGYIVRDLRKGDLPTRLRAARQTAWLLGHVRRVETSQAQPVLPQALTKPVLLSMTRAFLAADSPLVRAEMLAALHQVPLEEPTIALMGGCVEDDSPLVRLRLIELLAGKRTKGHETLLDFLSQDRDNLVREMAQVLRKSE